MANSLEHNIWSYTELKAQKRTNVHWSTDMKQAILNIPGCAEEDEKEEEIFRKCIRCHADFCSYFRSHSGCSDCGPRKIFTQEPSRDLTARRPDFTVYLTTFFDLPELSSIKS
jgi:hypothetical protein